MITPSGMHVLNITDVRDGTKTMYIKQYWYTTEGQPLRPFFGVVGVNIDDLIEIGRKVMSEC